MIMLTAAKISSAQIRLADYFLNDLRQIEGDNDCPNKAGWGQFVGQGNRSQVGLYGASAGIINISLAYPVDRIPDEVADYLTCLWSTRNSPGSAGARNFALTARRAFFLMALRLSGHEKLRALVSDADRELRERIQSDGLFAGWQIDKSNRGATGNETATSVAILAYALTGRREDIPPEIERAARALQARLDGAPSTNSGLRKFSLCSISLALSDRSLSANTRSLISQSRITPDTRGQDTIDFWDYDFKAESGSLSRRDYFHVPADAVDIMLACGHSADRFQCDAAVALADEAATHIIESGLYFGGREKATSKSQAWISLALHQSRGLLLPTKTQGGIFNRFVLSGKRLLGVPQGE